MFLLMKIDFQAEKKLKEGDLEGFPALRTKPETTTMHFEVLANVDCDKVIPEKVLPVKPVIVMDTVVPNVFAGNVSMSKTQQLFTRLVIKFTIALGYHLAIPWQSAFTTPAHILNKSSLIPSHSMPSALSEL
ncbi:hypothetical protein E2542_SST00290 [Spatholobus suberectus]|nr:hypothetical protein E2542_SST00290 [Spatholobus suberectus]